MGYTEYTSRRVRAHSMDSRGLSRDTRGDGRGTNGGPSARKKKEGKTRERRYGRLSNKMNARHTRPGVKRDERSPAPATGNCNDKDKRSEKKTRDSVSPPAILPPCVVLCCEEYRLPPMYRLHRTLRTSQQPDDSLVDQIASKRDTEQPTTAVRGALTG